MGQPFRGALERPTEPEERVEGDDEASRHATILLALGRRRFGRGLEMVGAGGRLTLSLAAACDAYLGIAPAEAALIDARRGFAHLPHARFECRRVPAEWPPGRFDLIVMSEVLRFLRLGELDRLADHCVAGLYHGGMLLLVNRLGPSDDAMSGEAAVLGFLAALPPGWSCLNHAMTSGHRIEVARSPV